jgi:hypothetical protein
VPSIHRIMVDGDTSRSLAHRACVLAFRRITSRKVVMIRLQPRPVFPRQADPRIGRFLLAFFLARSFIRVFISVVLHLCQAKLRWIARRCVVLANYRG